MKPTARFIPLLFALALSVPARAAAPERPNFLVILGEAQGWASMSAPLDDRHPEGSRSDFLRTPNLDALAARGARFSEFRAASPRCTPTRAALFTGLNPARLGMTFVNEGNKDGTVLPRDLLIAPRTSTELPVGIETIGTLLKRHGYATAHFGKWHAGRANPREHGFDENDGANSNGGPDNVEDPNPKQCHAIADLGIAFLERQARAGTPFFLQLSQYPGRGAQTARPETVDKVRRRLGAEADPRQVALAAGVEEIDLTIGRVLDRIEALGLRERTVVLYTADHGAQGPHANGMLSQGKGTVWEGGLRVPLLAAGPGIAPGVFVHAPASTVDLFPTIAALAGVPSDRLPPVLDGSSLIPLLQGGAAGVVARTNRTLVVHFPHYDKDPAGPASAVIDDHFKLIRFYEQASAPRLFDLAADPAERRDLAREKPEVVQRLSASLDAYLGAVKAGLPTPNPNHDPQAPPRDTDRRGGRGGGKGKTGAAP